MTIFLKGVVSNPGELKLKEPEKCQGWSWIKWTEICEKSKDEVFLPLFNLVESAYQPFDDEDGSEDQQEGDEIEDVNPAKRARLSDPNGDDGEGDEE